MPGIALGWQCCGIKIGPFSKTRQRRANAIALSFYPGAPEIGVRICTEHFGCRYAKAH
jgi:hypothetical protein